MTATARRSTLAVVVVDHDHPEAAAAQLQQLIAEAERAAHSVEIVLVQNGVQRTPAERFPKAKMIECENRGYGAAVNLGVRSTKAPVILALNADLVLTSSFLPDSFRMCEHLVEFESAPSRIGVIGGGLFDSVGRRQVSFGPWPSLSRLVFGLPRPRWMRRYWPTTNRFRDVPWATGACFMFRRDCWEELGGFDESFFMYYEDVDFCRRAWAEGWRVVFSPTPTATHFQPYHQRPVTVSMARMARRSTLVYFWKHRPRWEFHALARIIRMECRWRRSEPGWRDIDAIVQRVLSHPDEVPQEEP